MRHLCNILDKIDAGSETVIREHLDLALGVWSAGKGASHKIIAVSESSVAFADGEANLFVAHYTMTDGRVMLTDCRKLLNVSEEVNNTAFLDEFAAKFVDLVAEDREEEASKLIGAALEMKQRALSATKLVEQKESKESRARYLKESTAAGWRLLQEAKKSAKIKVFKKAAVLRKKIHEGTKLSKPLGELLEAAVNMLTALDLSNRTPLIEGFIIEKTEAGLPAVIRAKGSATLVHLAEGDDESEKPWEKKDDDKEDDKDDKDEKKDDKDDDKEDDEDDKDEKKSKKEDDKEDDKKVTEEDLDIYGGECEKCGSDDYVEYKNTRTCKQCKHKEYLDAAIKRGHAKKTKTDEGVIVVNLKTIRETVDPKKDFFYRAAVAWKSFRADPVTEATAALIKSHSTPAAIVEQAPFLALLGEDEVYEAIAPHIDAFDPADIRAVAKAIVAEGLTKEGKVAKAKFITSLNDNEITEAIKAEKIALSAQLDHLFLEGDDFDFGAADNLGNDDLSDDQNTDGLEDTDGEGDDELAGDDDLTAQGDDGQDEEGEQIQFSMSADRARELLKKVLDVVGDEIEDSDEFNDLKAKVDGTADGEDAGGMGGQEQPELTGDDITSMLQVIGDYFDAVGKDKTDSDEANAEDEMGSETLDDMSTIGDKGGDEAGAEGDQGAPPGQEQQTPSNDLNLGN